MLNVKFDSKLNGKKQHKYAYGQVLNTNLRTRQILDRIQDVLKDVNEKEYQDIFDGVGELEKTTKNLIFESPHHPVILRL